MGYPAWRGLAAVCYVAPALLTTELALAQGGGTADDGLALEEVVVTAQKREQSLQDVPISVVSFNREELELKVIDDLKDVANSVPNMRVVPFQNNPTTINLFIRGIGAADVQITQDPSVALYQDGVYIGTSIGAGFEGVDIERLEVLRGPQGTLYGRNATGGAVNIVTRRANVSQWMARQDLTGGNLGKFQSKTMVNIPIANRFAIKANYLHSQRGGYVDNEGPGSDFGEEDRNSLVLDLRAEATDALIFDYRYEKAKIKDSQRFDQAQVVDPGSGILAQLGAETTYTGVSEDKLDKATSFRDIQTQDLDIDAHTLWVGWDINDSLTFKSITAYRNLDSYNWYDNLPTAIGDYSNLPVAGAVGAPSVGITLTKFEQRSQEFQLLGQTPHWDYVVGLFYYSDEGSEDNSQSITLGETLEQTGRIDFTSTENRSLAAYGQATWNPAVMGQRWHFTAGVRYSADNRKASRDNGRGFPVPFTAEYDQDFSNVDPSLTVAFDITDAINIYGKVVSGHRSGGTSTRSVNAILFSAGFDEEQVLSYELGLKSGLWGGRARFNTALFRMELDGLQASVQSGSTPGERDFLPIDDNVIQGLEFDLDMLLTRGLTFKLGYGYLDTEIGADTITNPIGITYELVPEMPNVPGHSYTVGLNYQLPVKNGVWGFNASYDWQDDIKYTGYVADDSVPIEAFGLLDGAITWSDITLGKVPGSFRAMLWGKNLLDEEYALRSTGAFQPFDAVVVTNFGDPRTYGLTLTYIY